MTITGGDLAAILGSAATLVAAVAAAVVLITKELRHVNDRVAAEASDGRDGVEQVHKIVNQQRTDMIDAAEARAIYEQLLIKTLGEHGIRVPPDTAPDTSGTVKKAS